MEKIIKYKQGRNVVIDIGEYSITRIRLNQRQFDSLRHFFRELDKKDNLSQTN